jgi:hypothetical protein
MTVKSLFKNRNKLHGAQSLRVARLIEKFPALYGTRRFITVFTRTRRISLSWARWGQSIPSQPVYLRFIVILSSYLRLGLPSGLFPSGFPTRILYAFLISPSRATCPAHVILLVFVTLTVLGEVCKIQSSSLFSISPASRHFLPLGSKYSPQHPVLKHSLCSSLSVWDQVSYPDKTTSKISFSRGDRKTKVFELIGSKHSWNLICSSFLHERNFDLWLLFPSVWTFISSQ